MLRSKRQLYDVGVNSTLAYRQPRDEREFSAMQDIVSQSLHFPRDAADRYAELIGHENFRVVVDRARDEEVAGGLALIKMGQFFGGRSVPMVGVAAVGVAPEHRARGAATFMMQQMLHEQRAAGAPISALYPATLPLYRRVGYESAGVRYEITAPVKLIDLRERESPLGVRRMSESDHPVVEALYRETAQHRPGMLDRGAFVWSRVRAPRGELTHGYVVINSQRDDRIEGYIHYLQKDAQAAKFSLHVSDVGFSTPEAGRRLLSFIGGHRSMAELAVVQGSPDQPLVKLLPERNYSARLLDHWMLRIVDVGAALAKRGYARALTAEVHIDVVDDLLLGNNGRYVLAVSGGEASLSSGGRGDLRIDARGLAALYAGHMSPHELLTTGQLQVASPCTNADACLDDAAALFASAAPAMGDMF